MKLVAFGFFAAIATRKNHWRLAGNLSNYSSFLIWIQALALIANPIRAEEIEPTWSQFRGPNGSGYGERFIPPLKINGHQPTWKMVVPAGKSSPVIWGNRIFLTGVEKNRLVTLCLDTQSGQPVWKSEISDIKLESVHPANSVAASTPCADKERVYSYFGSWGLVCHDHSGKELWKMPIPTPRTMYGVATSPILHEDRLFLLLDDDGDLPGSKLSRSKLIALDKATGKSLWETGRPYNRGAWSTPMIWKHAKGTDLVALGDGRVCGYDPINGEERWHMVGFAREPIAVPIEGDGKLFVSVSMQGGRGDSQLDPEPFWKALLEFDTNLDGQIGREEISTHFTIPLRPELRPGHPGFGIPLPSEAHQRKERQDGMFSRMDRDKNGFITKQEYTTDMAVGRGRPTLAAILPGGAGNISESHVSWKLHSGIPEIPSPIHREGRLYMVRDGGILTCVKTSTGEVVYRERLGSPGQYTASPVSAGGHLFLVSMQGILTVVKCGDRFEITSKAELGSPIEATPAMDRNSLYVRTKDTVLAFR